VQVFDKAGKFLFKFGSTGNGDGQFSSLIGVTVARRNNQIVVADLHYDRIQVFDEKGGFIRAFGSSGSGDGQLSGPYGVVVDSQGNYFITDYDNHHMSIFDSNGQFLRKFGSSGNGNGQLSSPFRLGLLSNGNVAVGEYSNNRVSIFDSQGNFVRHICAKQISGPTTSSLIPMTTFWLPTTLPQTQSECSRQMELWSRIFPLLVNPPHWVSAWIRREGLLP